MNKPQKSEAKKVGITGILLGVFVIFIGLIMAVAGTNSFINGTDENRLPYDWLIALVGAGLVYGGYYMIKNNHEFTLKKTVDKATDGPIDPLFP